MKVVLHGLPEDNFPPSVSAQPNFSENLSSVQLGTACIVNFVPQVAWIKLTSDPPPPDLAKYSLFQTDILHIGGIMATMATRALLFCNSPGATGV